MEDYGYALDPVAATAVSPDEIDKTFRSTYTDLASSALGGRILAFSDQWFAEASNLLTPTAPVRQAGKMVFTGAWYDGWETRRHNREPFDWVVVRLGVASGTIAGVEVDTAFFSGNHAPAVSVEGCFSDDDDEVASWAGGRGGWETVLDVRECGPSRRFAWRLLLDSGGDGGDGGGKRYTHVRLNMYPDGGIARFRVFGRAAPVFPADADAVLDLAAAQNGGVAVSCSDQHFGTKDNLLLPGRGRDMGDGWETARSRARGHVDWAVVRLGARGYVQELVVDTAHFRGNFPQRVAVLGVDWQGEGEPPGEDGGDGEAAAGWVEVVGEKRCAADREHVFACEGEARAMALSHVKLVIIPDGGVKRLRVMGRRAV